MVIIGPHILKRMVNKTALALMKLTFSSDYCISEVNSHMSLGHQKLTLISFGLDQESSLYFGTQPWGYAIRECFTFDSL